MKDTIVRDMNESDLKSVLRLAEQTKELWASSKLRYPFGKKDLKKWLNFKEDDELLVVECGKQLIGFSIASVNYDAAQIISIAIKKEYRNKKIGYMLFKEMMKRLKKKHVKKFYLNVQTKNIKAINFYRKNGFELSDMPAYFMYRGSWKK